MCKPKNSNANLTMLFRELNEIIYVKIHDTILLLSKYQFILFLPLVLRNVLFILSSSSKDNEVLYQAYIQILKV